MPVLPDQLLEKARRLPDAPGVYLMKDAVDQVIYAGKARSLRKRVRTYFSGEGAGSPKLQALQNRIKDFEYMVTDSEEEALILECTLIKEHRPRYNINLRDDKDYPYLRLTEELYPRLEYLRLSQRHGRKKSGKNGLAAEKPSTPGKLFGPYTSAGAVRSTMRLLSRLFPLRRCRQPLTGESLGRRPCLNYQIRRCLAPCRGAVAVDPEDYKQLVEKVALFLEGKQSELESRLDRHMQKAAREEKFETAARLRDQLAALRQVGEGRKKVLAVDKARDQDVIALVRLGKSTAVHQLIVREGRLCNQEHFPLAGAAGATDREALAAFLKSYYSRGVVPPAELLLSHDLCPEEKGLLGKWLRKTAGYSVSLMTPRRGFRRHMVELASRNGILKLEEEARRSYRQEELPLKELARLTSLTGELRRIEGYDISHLQGGEGVGSMVVFMQGRPYKDGYRHFHLRHAPPGDDYAALQEVIRRRAGRKEWPLPDLMLIDGGKGQLRAVREALNRSGLEKIKLISLAKNPEQIFLEGVSSPVILPESDQLLQLLQRIRDEAHRFALDYHRRLRRQSGTRSGLEKIPGIGPKRRAALLSYFGGMENLMQASEEEIAKAPGFHKEMARRLFNYLHGL